MSLTEERSYAFWMQIRDSLLKQVDAIERMLEITPRTSELRKMAKETKVDTKNVVE